MNKVLLIILCFLTAIWAANITPLLTGTGYVVFPEAAPSANISATTGTLNLNAGGTNQNIGLTPSGAGKVIINSDLDIVGGIYRIGGVAGVSGSLTLTANTVTLQYKDWSGSNQSQVVVTSISLTTNTFTNGIRTQ